MNLKRTQIALSNYPYFKYSLSYTLDSLAKLGAHEIELYACDPHFHIDDTELPQVVALKKNLKERDLRPICLTPEQVKYPVNIASPNPVCRKRSVGTYIKCIQYANELECPSVQFHAGFATLDDSQDRAWSRSFDSLSCLADIAKGYGVTVMMESAPKTMTILTDSGKVAKMVSEINSPALWGMIDTLTLVLCNETIDTAIRNIGPTRIGHFHISDAVTKAARDHVIPGEGDLDLEYMIKALDKAEYSHYITLEMLDTYEMNPEEAMRKGADWLRAHIAD
jgi:protein FrlC